MIPPSSLKWQQYQALLELLPEQHPTHPQIVEKFRITDIGETSEDSLEFFLRQANVPSLTFIKRLRIEENIPFQIDWLVLASSFRVLFEVKGHNGEIHFDAKANQLTRSKEGITESFTDPILQVDRQYANLRTFLIDQQKESLPTYRYAVFVNPRVILKLNDYPEFARVITGQAVPFVLEKHSQKHPPIDPKVSNQHLAALLIQHHHEKLSPILEKHHILWEDLKKGIPCPRCQNRAMIRERMRWQCIKCEHRSTDAHIPVLYALALLTQNRLTSKLVQDFLQLESLEATRKLIKRAGYIKFGVKKAVYYAHPELLTITKSKSGHKSIESGHKV
ncbi:nuclease-related domain-containing protein [Gracilibacillus massiliensis]|uniref:nuclease-related domain-containing protein n=1 Tax=Gracilibacillus massiliensis TaxID=1564956 RepID=UPI00071DE400|nr:nuclease-related domain-containing protein [Gracilibacillus massiliensis]